MADTPHAASMADFEALLNAQFDGYRKGFSPGERVRGTVVSVNGAYVVLDVQAKNEGLIPVAELRDEEGKLLVAPGQSLEAIFIGVQGGAFVFSMRLEGAAATDRGLAQAQAAGLPVEGLVKAEVNGGYEIDIHGQRAFCPFSQIDRFKTEGAVYVGQKFAFLVTEYDAEDRNIVVSRRALLDKERAAQRDALAGELQAGQVRRGTVTRLAEFGIFVDLGGIEGLIPLKELAWQRDTKPTDVAKAGDTVEVLVREVDWERDRITLSLRGTQTDPWNSAVERYPAGSAFLGKVVHLEPFGAFVQVVPGVEGLIPIGRLGGGRRLRHPREALSEGQELEVQVESIDPERRRISLKPLDSRVATLKPGSLERGAMVEGIVEGIKDFGVFLRLSETQTGLLHIGETDVGKGGNPASRLERLFAPGSKVQVVVKENDGKRISLTLPARWQAATAGDSDDTAGFLAGQRTGSKSLGSLGDAFKGLDL